ncbi:MAG TPA: threonine synthase [Chloroflexi bacterium]|nr:threonine synthase [Chloroflexota bacterium]
MASDLPASPWPGVVAHYRTLIDLPPDARPVTLLEGNTPLIPVPRLADALGGGFDLWLKYEGLNPTGSFKDRGMTAAITQAVHAGAEAVICASTGNTAASAAAYAARAGLRCIVIVPEGKIAKGKLAGSLAYGAEVVNISGNFDEGLALVREASERLPVTLVNSINPYRLEGQKTAAFEIVDVLGDAPDWLCLPVGNAGNITAYWMGFVQYQQAGNAHHTPRLLGAQAAGAAPIVRGEVVPNPETVATAIRIGNPARWREAAQALEESEGQILAVTDGEILEAWRMLSTLEGVFVEPASAAGVAGLRKQIREGEIDVRGKRIVCVVTGHGLKDPEIVLRSAGEMVTLEPDFDALADYLEMPAT